MVGWLSNIDVDPKRGQGFMSTSLCLNTGLLKSV